jgi:hypothetical protein
MENGEATQCDQIMSKTKYRALVAARGGQKTELLN